MRIFNLFIALDSENTWIETMIYTYIYIWFNDICIISTHYIISIPQSPVYAIQVLLVLLPYNEPRLFAMVVDHIVGYYPIDLTMVVNHDFHDCWSSHHYYYWLFNIVYSLCPIVGYYIS